MKTTAIILKFLEENGEPYSNCEECSYNGIGSCCLERENDALRHLKEYQKVDSHYWSEKAISELNNIADAIFSQTYREDKNELTALRAFWKEQHENAPLTWDELKTMEGKPVWVEALLYKQWAVIGYVGENHIRFEGVNLYAPESRTYMGAENGWQAYRKEREATGGNLTPEPKSKKICDDTEIKWREND